MLINGYERNSYSVYRTLGVGFIGIQKLITYWYISFLNIVHPVNNGIQNASLGYEEYNNPTSIHFGLHITEVCIAKYPIAWIMD